MLYYNQNSYNVVIETPRFKLVPMGSHETDKLLEICKKDGFTYPYIHSRKDSQHLPLEERVAKYTALGDKAAAGEFGNTLIQSIYAHGDDKLLGASILFATSKDDPLFIGTDPEKEWEIGAFVDIDHWRENIAMESLYYTIQHGVKNWGLKGLWASAEPSRKGSAGITRKLQLEQVGYVEAGSEHVPYNDNDGNSAARNIYHTMQNWQLPVLTF